MYGVVTATRRPVDRSDTPSRRPGSARLADSRSDTTDALSVDSIARAAEHLVDTEGVGALTMRRLGRELGVEAMSIYHHLPNKAALEDAIVTRLLAPADVIPPETPPLDAVEWYVRSIRTALRARPRRVPLVTGRLPATLFDAPAPRAVIDSLVRAGFDRSASAWILDAFVGYVIGHALVEHSDVHATTDDDGAAFDTGLRFLLIGLREDLGIDR